MKRRSCGLVPRIGTVDSATPHPDPSGGQASALHFLIPPSTTGRQFGAFRRWRAGIEVDGRAHPGSESGMCFRTNRPCQLVPAHQGMKMRPSRWRCLGVVGAALPLWIPAFARMTRCDGGRPAGVCHAPPRVPTRDTPTVMLGVGGIPVGITAPASRPTAGDKPQPYILRWVSTRMAAIRRAVSAKCWTSSGLRGRRRMVRSR